MSNPDFQLFNPFQQQYGPIWFNSSSHNQALVLRLDLNSLRDLTRGVVAYFELIDNSSIVDPRKEPFEVEHRNGKFFRRSFVFVPWHDIPSSLILELKFRILLCSKRKSPFTIRCILHIPPAGSFSAVIGMLNVGSKPSKHLATWCSSIANCDDGFEKVCEYGINELPQLTISHLALINPYRNDYQTNTWTNARGGRQKSLAMSFAMPLENVQNYACCTFGMYYSFTLFSYENKAITDCFPHFELELVPGKFDQVSQGFIPWSNGVPFDSLVCYQVKFRVLVCSRKVSMGRPMFVKLTLEIPEMDKVLELISDPIVVISKG